MLLFHLRNFTSVDSNKSYNIYSNFMHNIEQSVFDKIWHQMSFYNLYALVCAKIMRDLSQILLVLIVDYFSSILWRKDDMVLAQPFGMCSTISLWHEITFPFSVVAWTPLLYGKVISL